ncbi:KAP family P-loop domain-containing protein [Flavobacterium fryxellicola]|uniref:KAP NTPase domain-containing protein n=1 Tax=Flavobacterium fryxellicola TaxID=249352 RepID=A0A167V2F0_9FLAO|nr:P-loop NTPase fold protein [Flavobacterium fryxellicola]OAB26017.1 hypothetical protein FBFR_13485 [Flavobacterium fryxellicola]SHN80389.1 KAP family P-loop domain-containing protein [Flavobacterium fryxellicola]
MSIRHNNIDIEPDNPFANCKLERKKYANVLLDLVNSYNNGFVLAINNKWGTGKTTFIKMWEQDLKDKDFRTVYFNAWENDFENNALIALMGELKNLTTKATEPRFKKALKNAAILSKHIAPIIVQSIADKYINATGIKDALVNATKSLNDIFENDVNEYAKKKKGIKEFHKSLSEFIANTNDGKPLIFFIDELDRCRPNYAVSILEQIKHFFSVPNIVFVLSIDKIELGNSVRGVYGSDKIDADEYLRRFIDIEYTIPNPENDIFHKYLYNYFEFDQFFNLEDRKKHRELELDKNNFLNICSILFSNGSISLRQQEKIFSHSRLALRSFESNNYVIPQLFLFLVYIKTIHEDFYNKINCKTINIVELQKEFLQIMMGKIDKNTESEIIRLEVYLVNTYNNYLTYPYQRANLYEHDISGKAKLLINSVIDKTEKGDLFLRILENMSRYDNIENLSIEHLLKKINLTEVFKS